MKRSEKEVLVEVINEVEAIPRPITVLFLFFSLSKTEQVALLPKGIKEQKYDFPDGDFVSRNVVAVLMMAYEAALNSIAIRVECSDSYVDDDYPAIYPIIEALGANIQKAIWNAPED